MHSIRRAPRTLTLVLLFALSLPTAAAPIPDTSFGVNGMVEQPFPGNAGVVDSVLALRDGKLLAGGFYFHGLHGGLAGIPIYAGFPLARYNHDGSRDAGFGNQGIFNPPPLRVSLVQRDGKMVGVSQTGLTRFNQDGTPDVGFIADGATGLTWFAQVSDGFLAVAQQADGKIVVAGNTSYTVVLLRFNANGSLDTSFNYVGAVLVPHGDADIDLDMAGLVIQPDGKLAVATSSVVGAARKFTVVRYNPNGTPDATFGSNGRTSATFGGTDQDTAAALLRQPSGRLVVVGSHDGLQLQLVGFRGDNGALDATFGAAGVVRGAIGGATSTGSGGIADVASVGVKDAITPPDGKLLVATSTSSDLLSTGPLLRFTLDGAADATFGVSGAFASPQLPVFGSVALQPDGDLVLGGSSTGNNFAVGRFLSGPSAAIEFYNAALDHYFVSMNPQEVDDLDLGVHGGWQRTGLSFPVFGSLAAATAAAAGVATNPVCRFYIPPQHGDSHFFSADLFECQQALAKTATDPNFSGYFEETASAFFVAVPNHATGACPSGTTPIYRLWNARFDSNHRYTTDVAVKAQMVARGYVAEGYGPNAVNMCAPQ